jgi:molecular chaperone GrpE
MGIQRWLSQLRTRVSGAIKMDEDSTKNEVASSEQSTIPPQDGTGGNTPVSEDQTSDNTTQPGVASLDSEPSDAAVAQAQAEPPGGVLGEGSPDEASQEIQAPIPFEKYQEVLDAKEKLYDRFLRKQAEFENFRKRTEKEKQEFYDFALARFVKELLPVLDGLERGLYGPESETVESYKKGMELILKQFRDALSSAGLQPIRAIGTIFDPSYHQAVMREENNNLAENEIIEELQRGYTFKDRLLRPSMVKVAVALAAVPDATPSGEVAPSSQE